MQRICWSDWILFCQKKRAKIDFLKTPSSRLSEDGSIGGCESYWRYGWMLWRCDLGVRSLFLTQFLDVRCLLVWQLENSSWDVSCYDCRPTARGNPHHYIYIYQFNACCGSSRVPLLFGRNTKETHGSWGRLILSAPPGAGWRRVLLGGSI